VTYIVIYISDYRPNYSISQSYVKSCVFCKESIKMSDENGKWLPYNQDGSQHDCKKETKNQDISVEILLKKLEIIGIKIDLQKLRNVK
jgi:hypothetical protein